jgi:membrane associated rhomboid family serine protease
VTDQPVFDSRLLLEQSGPLTRDAALGALAQAGELLASADFGDAARLYNRVIGFNDAAITSAAMIGLGEAFHRMDDDGRALGQWLAATELPENEHTYAAWRNVAAARVRAGDLTGALSAYREADRRAPQDDKAEIASRMGWLSKELGDRGAAGRYFARARGEMGTSFAVIVIAVTTIVSLIVDLGGPAGSDLGNLLAMDKVAIANGEIWRLWTVTLVHAPIQSNPFHLLFNMYALWLAGPFVERLYGRWAFLAFYLLAAAGGSLASFAFGDARYAVGASGAIFGLFGVLVAVRFVHRPVLDRQSRGFLGQIVALAVLNILLGFVEAGVVDVWAHMGGLITGIWLGALFAPTRVPTLRSLWLRPGPTPGVLEPAFGAGGTVALRAAGVLLMLAAFVFLWVQGVAVWGVPGGG